jgi:predicted nucleic acid-binding protein
VKFLVDANVLSEAARPQADELVLAWLGRNEAEVAVNPVILGEMQYGILLLSPGKKRTRLLKWFASGVKHLPVLDLDAETASVWASLLADLKRKGRAMPVKDSLIAATARQHRLTVATRNTANFADAGVKLINPFDG